MKKLLLLVCATTLTSISLSAYCPTCPSGGERNSKGQLRTYTHYDSRHDRSDDLYRSKNDRKILKKIRKSLDQNGFNNERNNIVVEVEYGKVEYKGRVSTQEEMQQLEEVARGQNGVRHVIMNVYVDDQNMQNRNRNQNGRNGQSDGRQNNGYSSRGRNSLSSQISAAELDQYQSSKGSNGRNGSDMNGNQSISDSELKAKVDAKVHEGWFSKTHKNVEVEVNNGVVTLSGTVKSENDKQSLERKVREINEVIEVENQIDVVNKNHNKHQNGNSNDSRMNQNHNRY